MQFLTEAQRALLTVVGKSSLAQHIYFTGGTLLSFFYLKHRRSLDLDFFSDDLLDDLFVSKTIKEISVSVNAKEVLYTRYPSRAQYFFKIKEEEVKFEIAYFPFPNLGRRIYLPNFKLKADSLRDIATNKVHACFERDAPRDTFDLYSILKVKKWTLTSLLSGVEHKFGVTIDLAHLVSRLLSAVDKMDEVRPLFIKRTPDYTEIKKFFMKESRSYLSRRLR